MRDRLIHFYFGVNLEVVWVVATKEINELKANIAKMIEAYFDSKENEQ